MKIEELPEHLTGPFVTAQYDWQTGRVTLKNEQGERVRVTAYQSAFVLAPHLKKIRALDSDHIIYSQSPEGKYVRFNFRPGTKRDQIFDFVARLEDKRIPVLEADVHPIRRWFADTGSLVSQKFRSLFFDLESHPLVLGFSDEAKKSHRIISCAAYDLEGNSWFWSAAKSSDAEEAKVISAFLDVAQDYDTLLAWNGDNYDFFVLKERCRYLDLRVGWSRWNLLDYLGVTKKLLSSVTDPLLKRSFALDAIGENVLGLRKVKTSVGSGKLHELLGRRAAELEAYNRRDVEIMIALEEKRSFLALHYALCSIARTFPTRNSLYPSELADGVLLRMGITDGVHFATRRRYSESDDDSKTYEGAYVMSPQLGFHGEVQVADFASLYPSIMISWNISHETKIKETGRYPSRVIKTAAISTATGVRFRTDIEGLIPRALRILLTKRKEYSSQLKSLEVGSEAYKSANNLSTAVKVVANTFYGLIGAQSSRYYDVDLARSVTLTGQYLIRQVIEYFRAQGYSTVASDTDSVFVAVSSATMAIQLDEINRVLLPKVLEEQGCPVSTVKLDSDKSFHSLLIVTKKRYAGVLATQKGKPAPPGTLEIKGLETQRSNEIRYGQRLQKEALIRLLDPSSTAPDIEQWLSAHGNRFFEDDIPVEDIEILEGVSKHPSEYTTKSAPVLVAEWLIAQGEEFFAGMKIPYVVIEHEPQLKAIHTSQYRGHFDRIYYWQKRILPPVLRLLESRFSDYTFKDFSNPRQLDFRWTMRTRKVRLPKAAAPERKLARLIIPGHCTTAREMKTIRKLIDVYPGEYNLEIHVEINQYDTVEISTKQTINARGLEIIQKNLPYIKIVGWP